MTTMILATIGIVLAAAAALMTVYYGGGMYTDGAVTARADTVSEAGKNVVAGYNTYELRNGSPPGDIADMLKGSGSDGVLSSMPSVGGIGDMEQEWVGLDRGRGLERAFAVRDISDDVCARINRIATGSDVMPTSPDRDFGCYKADGDVAVYYAFVGPVAASDRISAYAAPKAAS